MKSGTEPTCGYCGKPARLVKGSLLYPNVNYVAHKNFWRCDPCDAHIGCHDPDFQLGFDGTEPLGTLAKADLREARIAAHGAFDALWKRRGLRRGKMRRSEAYAWLAKELDVPKHECHIGMFDKDTCYRVVNLCRNFRVAKARAMTKQLGGK